MAVNGFDPSNAVAVDDTTASSGFNPTNAVPVDDDQPAPDETAGRVAGLGGRALLKGTGSLVDLPSKLLAVADHAGVVVRNHIRDAFGLEPDATDAAPPSNLGERAAGVSADVLGLPTPQTPGERVASSAIAGTPSAVLAPEAPIMGAVSGALGGGAAQTVAEAGGTPLQQTIAGIAAGGIPAIGAGAAGLTRLATRGGSAGQAAMNARLADAAANNVDLTAGQATGSPLLQRIEGASSKIWGGGPIKATAEQQTEGLGNNVDRIVDNLSQGGDVSPTGAGEAINAGAATTRQSMKAAERAAYDAVDQHVPPTTGIDISGTLSKLDQMATPTPGAQATTGSLIPSKIVQMRDNLAADVKANGGSALPYSAVRQLRTALGNSIDLGFAPADPVTNGALKSVYGSLKSDITDGVSAVSPAAKRAVTDADALHGANQDKLDVLNGIVDKAGGPEAVYQAATNGTKQGATKVTAVMSALDPQQANLVRATVISRLGRALPGQQNAAGDAFDASRFLTNWAKLDGKAKDALFGASGTPNTIRAGLDSLTNTMSTVRNSTIFKNPSGSGEAIGHGFGLAALLEGGGAALMGHPGHLAAVGGTIAANNVLARALTNPRTVAWLASSTKLPTSVLPNAVNQLARMGEATKDPDAQDLAALLRSRGLGR
jgi:hypothetical protein